jgi:hypothetical protein
MPVPSRATQLKYAKAGRGKQKAATRTLCALAHADATSVPLVASNDSNLLD